MYNSRGCNRIEQEVDDKEAETPAVIPDTEKDALGENPSFTEEAGEPGAAGGIISAEGGDCKKVSISVWSGPHSKIDLIRGSGNVAAAEEALFAAAAFEDPFVCC